MMITGMLTTAWARAEAAGLQISGGIDARYVFESRSTGTGLVLHGLFLNGRKVWSDALGDRWVAVAQADLDDNLRRIRPYQVYLQYKGPLGKWNARAGHFLLPFGLLATHDTERLVLQGLEESSLGIRKDTGAQILGYVGDWDYSLSVTTGVGDRRVLDVDGRPMVTGRVAHVGESWTLGISLLAGSVLPDSESEACEILTAKRRIAFDATASLGRLTIRSEMIGGTDDGRAVGGGIVLAGYALGARLELGSRAAFWHGGDDSYFAGVGITYRLWRGLSVRLADQYEFGTRENNVFTTQVYFESSHQF